MLPIELIRVKSTRTEVAPSFVAPSSLRYLERAAQLLELAKEGASQGWTRGELGSRFEEEVVGSGIDHRLTRGLAQIVEDQCGFASVAPLEPVELRARLFAGGPAPRQGLPGGPPTTRDRVASLAAELGCVPDVIERGLFADLKENQVLESAPDLGADAILHRYNLVLVQSLLLRAGEVVVDLGTMTPERARQLFRHIKFRQLMHRIRQTPEGWRITLDGPNSIFQLSTKYGLQLAQFLPALLLQPGPWKMTAIVKWDRYLRTMVLTHEAGLKGSLPDQGAWVSREEEWFEERFRATPSPWTLSRGAELIDLGGEAVLIPDFTFRNGLRVGHLEVLGHWRKNYLDERLRMLDRCQIPHVLLAVSRNLLGDKGKGPSKMDGRVIPFSKIIPPKDVIQALEERAIGE